MAKLVERAVAPQREADGSFPVPGIIHALGSPASGSLIVVLAFMLLLHLLSRYGSGIWTHERDLTASAAAGAQVAIESLAFAHFRPWTQVALRPVNCQYDRGLKLATVSDSRTCCSLHLIT